MHGRWQVSMYIPLRPLGLNEVSKRGHWGGQQGQDQIRVKQVRPLGLNEGGCIVSVCPPAILAQERVGHLIIPLPPSNTRLPKNGRNHFNSNTRLPNMSKKWHFNNKPTPSSSSAKAVLGQRDQNSLRIRRNIPLFSDPLHPSPVAS